MLESNPSQGIEIHLFPTIAVKEILHVKVGLRVLSFFVFDTRAMESIVDHE